MPQKLYALLLIGGRSSRMGTDKSLLDYHGLPQWQYNLALFDGLVDKVFISVRKEQQIDYENIIEDKYDNLGPFGAILTAMETYPNIAFLVFATDIPFLTKDNIIKLINERDANKKATVFQGFDKDYPEPLACIWEPSMLAELRINFEKQNYRAIAVLKNNDIKIVNINDEEIQNINTYEEYLNCKKKK
jgi:molybdopterin-guanine dinucleotide biosynthesis protein A